MPSYVFVFHYFNINTKINLKLCLTFGWLSAALIPSNDKFYYGDIGGFLIYLQFYNLIMLEYYVERFLWPLSGSGGLGLQTAGSGNGWHVPESAQSAQAQAPASLDWPWPALTGTTGSCRHIQATTGKMPAQNLNYYFYKLREMQNLSMVKHFYL